MKVRLLRCSILPNLIPTIFSDADTCIRVFTGKWKSYSPLQNSYSSIHDVFSGVRGDQSISKASRSRCSFFVHSFSRQRSSKLAMHVCLASGLVVRPPPDAWTSRMLLLHIDRRHRRCCQSCSDHLLHDLRVSQLQSRHPSAFCHSSLLLHTPPHFSLLYTSSTEYRRGQRRAVVLDQGLLRTVRRVERVGRDASPPQPTPAT